MRKMHAPLYPLLLVALCFGQGLVLSEDAPPVQTRAAIKDATPANEHVLFERVLALNRVQEPELDATELRRAFEELLDRARSEVDKADTAHGKIAALNKVLLEDRQVSYLSNLYWRDATLAASLMRKHGNCLSTATLYMVVGDALNLPIHMVMLPRHAFARWDDGQEKINIETTNKGFEMADRAYLRWGGQPSDDDIEKLGWCKSLSADEAMAELHVIAAGHRAGENKLEEAIGHLNFALKLAPNRSDRLLYKTSLLANLPGKRDEARRQMQALAARGSNSGPNALPPSVVTGALTFLAEDAAGAGDHATERVYYLRAFLEAPKPLQEIVLTRLAFCLRALKDYHGAVRYMELAIAASPDEGSRDTSLYNLAILQKNSGDVKGALQTIEKARKLNPENWGLQILQAGYLVADGQRERGMELFETLDRPRGEEDFCDVMNAWFWAACHEPADFYMQFEHALECTSSPHILEWVDQDPDLDFLREDDRFKELVNKHRARLMGKR